MLTEREEWILEGKMEGIMEGQIFVINNLIQSGMDWNIIAYLCSNLSLNN